ncbi:hypothetical protein R6Q59_024247 [Mikania micrantha]
MMSQDRKESTEFRNMVLAWMKQQEKNSINSSGSDFVTGQDVKGVTSNVYLSPFSYSIGSGLVHSDGLSGVGQPQPNSTFNSRPPEKSFQSRGEGSQPNMYSAAGVILLQEHGQTNSNDRGVRSLSRTEWEDRRMKGLCARRGQQFEPTPICSVGKRNLLLGTDESDYGEGKHLLLEVDNAPNQITIDACSFVIDALAFETRTLDVILGMDWLQSLGEVVQDRQPSWMKFIHEGHSVMWHDLLQAHTTKVALNLWLFGEEVAFQLGDVEQDSVTSNSRGLTLAQPSSLSRLHSSTLELGHALHRDRGAQHLLHLGWKGRRKKGKCLRWGNRYGPAHKCPETRSVKWGRIND